MVNRCAGMSALFFTDQKVENFDGVMTSDTAVYADYFKKMLDMGNMLPPSQYEGIFVSLAHTEADIDKTIADNRKALEAIVEGR